MTAFIESRSGKNAWNAQHVRRLPARPLTLGEAMPAISLTLVDEYEHCSETSSFKEFLDTGRSSARLTLSTSGYIGRHSQFDDLIGPAGGRFVPNWWAEDPMIFQGPLTLFRLSEAYYLPEFGVLIAPDGKVMKRTFEEARFFLKELSNLPLETGGLDDCLRFIPDDLERFGNVAVTFPWGAATNYGHFVVDCLSGIALINQHEQLLGFGHVFPPLKKWQQRHLELMGVRSFRQLKTRIVKLENVVFSNCLDHFLHVSNGILNAVAEPALTFLGLLHSKSLNRGGRRIYLSRRNINGRRFHREPEVEEALSVEGFEIVVPENLTVDEQIITFANADIIAGFTGAAFSNVIYCKPNTRIIEIQTAALQGIWVRNLALIAKCSWHPFFSGDLTIANAPNDNDMTHGPQWDTAEFCLYVTSICNPPFAEVHSPD